jgi:hypothetical protein
MSPEVAPFELNPGLRIRFLTAGEQIVWRPVPLDPPRPADRRGRVASLREDTARLEEWGSQDDGGLTVDSSPLGALALMVAIIGRGSPNSLGALHAGRDPAFPSGALVAVWGTGTAPDDERPRLRDVVDLARYALE